MSFHDAVHNSCRRSQRLTKSFPTFLTINVLSSFKKTQCLGRRLPITPVRFTTNALNSSYQRTQRLPRSLPVMMIISFSLPNFEAYSTYSRIRAFSSRLKPIVIDTFVFKISDFFALFGLCIQTSPERSSLIFVPTLHFRTSPEIWTATQHFGGLPCVYAWALGNVRVLSGTLLVPKTSEISQEPVSMNMCLSASGALSVE